MLNSLSFPWVPSSSSLTSSDDNREADIKTSKKIFNRLRSSEKAVIRKKAPSHFDSRSHRAVFFVLTLYLAGDNKGLSPNKAAFSVLKQLKIKCMLASSRCELYNTTGRYKAFCCGLSSFHINLALWQSLLNSEACHESQYILIFVRRADLRFTPFLGLSHS